MDAVNPKVRVRFCPSPTGVPHVGLLRTCLFNWAFAKKQEGSFIFRIEDTDLQRSTKESMQQILKVLTWLGFDADEGPLKKGAFGPYLQSERTLIYKDMLARLFENNYLYESFTTAEETMERNIANGFKKEAGYDNFDRNLTKDQIAEFKAMGRQVVYRFKMPDRDITWVDGVRGEITFAAGSVADFPVARANGDPLYAFVNSIDDALMKITHILRGEDLLPSTPRQIALHEAMVALGFSEKVPEFAHLPYVLGKGNKKLAKRDPEASALLYMEEGYLPEGLLNYLALLGWSMGSNTEIFSLKEMCTKFELHAVNANPARFDPEKCLVINASHMRLLDDATYAKKLREYLKNYALKDLEKDSIYLQKSFSSKVTPLIKTRVRTFKEASTLLSFFWKSTFEITSSKAFIDFFTIDSIDSIKTSKTVLMTALPLLQNVSVPSWTKTILEETLKTALLNDLNLKPKLAFAPLRMACMGSKVSPPLFESLEILGKDETLARLTAALALV